MIQEYLFSDKTQQNKLIQYKPNNVDCEITDFENSDCWMATYTVPHEDEDAAKALSDVNEYVMRNYHPTVLSNGSAAYFNKKLFPLVNELKLPTCDSAKNVIRILALSAITAQK